MKFMRRPDLEPQTRIQIVMTAGLHQGVYGQMTKHRKILSDIRTFLYQLLLWPTCSWKTLFSDESSCFKKIIVT